MSWFAWMVTHLFVGSIVMGFLMATAAKRNTIRLKDRAVIVYALIGVAFWPVFLSCVLALGIAEFFSCSTEERKTTDGSR